MASHLAYLLHIQTILLKHKPFVPGTTSVDNTLTLDANKVIVSISYSAAKGSGTGIASTTVYKKIDGESAEQKYSVSQNLTGVIEVTDGAPTVSVSEKDIALTLYFKADKHYKLPKSVALKMGGVDLSTDDYTWDETTGELMIMPSSFSSDIEITIVGIEDERYNIDWVADKSLFLSTLVFAGDKVILPTTDPAAPQGCQDKVFMGWSATNIGTTGTDNAPDFITAETVPSGDVTYYAVFATETKSSAGGSGTITYGWEDTEAYANLFDQNFNNTNSSITANEGSKYGTNGTKAGNTFYIQTKTKYAVTSVKFKYSKTTTNTTKQTWILQTSDDGTNWTDNSTTFSASGATKGTWSEASWTLDGKEVYVKITMGTNNTATRTIDALSITYGGAASTTYTDYVTNCIECTAPTTPLSLSVADAMRNLGEDGTAKTTFSTTGGNGGAIDYVVNPTTGADIDKDNKTITFTQAGTYTLTARQDLNTTDGTTYCGSCVSQTIKVTSTPVFGTATIDKSSFDVNCGDTTSMNSAAVITFGTNYNLTKPITITAPEGFLVSTNKSDKTKYATSVALTPTASGDNAGKIKANVYVCAYSAIARAEGYTGDITIVGDEITMQKIAVSSIVTCKKYTLTFVDRGATYATKNLYAGVELAQSAFPPDPTGVCTEPINYVFDGWATAEVANGSTTYTSISFPYTMPKGNTTLYAVYRYVDSENNDFQIADADVDLEDGKDCILTAQSSSAEYALSSVASTDVAGRMTTKEVAVDEDEAVLYKIQNVTDNTIIWTLEGNASDGYSFLNKSTGTYLTAASGTLSLEASATTKYTISHPDPTKWPVEVQRKGSSYYLSGYKLGEVLFSDYSKSTLKLYLYVRAYSYTSSPVCGPYIKATGDVAITSGKGIWVESVTPLTISAKNLDKNDDNAAVTITATVTDEAAANGFSIKTPGTQGAGSAKTPVELAKNYTDATYDGVLTVVYTPTEDNVTTEGKIALRVYKSGGSATYATDTIVVRGRSLPAEFVLAAETANGWVALPSDLAVGSDGALKYPYSITVNDASAPTKATQAPKTAIYMSADRSAKNTAATAIRLKNAGNQYLQGSTAKDETNVWLSNQNSEQAQSWELRSADFTHYFVRMQASEAGRYLSYDAKQSKIGNYKQEEASLYILPVEKTCVRFDAPKLDVHALTSTSATILWEAIADVAEYEYSLDDGATWQTCTGVQTMGTAIQWTLGGLETQKQYTIWVRAKVADGETNCSDYDSKTFTTTTCDDVPTDLWSSATANSVTITWNAQAATATVKIYSDDKGENEVLTKSGLTSPAKIVGLEPNTKYYFQVLADGTCASAIDDFWTESNEVSIVEWEKEAVIVDINTDVTDADDVSILVENQTTHGSNNKNIADDLFFSKYYEATGNVKLIGIYNGTKDTLSLANMYIYLGVTSWNKISLSKYGRKKYGYIAPNEEIILWYMQDKDDDKEIISCAEKKMDMNIMDKNPSVSFSGKQTFALVRGTEVIDVMGAVDSNSKGIADVSPIEGDCDPTWGDMKNGEYTWCGTGYSIVDKTTEIQLSMNRCLLVRSNKVKSGANAVANNVGAFNTLTKGEWLGRQVLKGSDNGVTESCEGFAYVADFNYNDYYTTYDSVAKLEIKGNRNADGTYTIPVPRMDTMACTNMRLQLKKAGVVIASREYKVPIVVDKSINTQNATYFGGNKLTDEVCATCDVVVRDKARLEHVAGGRQQFREMYVYAGSTFNIPEGQSMTLDKVRMFACNDTVSYAIINNSNATDAAISVKEVSHVKRIDGKYWYPFSLPYDCNIADIDQLSGQTLGVYGEDWGIKFYNGKRRQSDGNSTTHYGEVSKYWTMMPEDGVLKAYTGYIIGLFYPDENLMRSVNFPPATLSAYTEDATSKSTTITNWPDNLQAQPRHHGWNFVGSPYISLFGAAQGEGLYNSQLTMGWTDAYGEQQDNEHIYVSIPDGGNSNTYTQALASGVTIKPFTAYFVQAIDPTDNQSHTLSLTYSKTNRHLQAAPAHLQNAEPLILAELDIRCGALHDNTGVLVSDVYSADYEIGDDLYKMYAAAAKPQLYTIDASSEKMAYQALPDPAAHAVLLGIYLPAAGDYTLSLNRSVSRVASAEAVCLLHDGKVVADLLQTDYTLTAAARGSLGGYTLDIRRAPKMPTDILPAAGDAPYLMVRDGVLTVANLPAGAMVQVYDVLGRVLLRTTATEQSLSVPAAQTGVYTVLITTDNLQTVLKTLLR